jgi:regulatory protein YycH of two-component signal transduction system YycFG
MIEKLKSLALIFLIIGSLYQSYQLAYNTNRLEPNVPNNYVESEPLGSQTDLKDLLFPDQIIVHMGNQQHTVLYPATYSYNSLLDNIKERKFEGFRKTTTYMPGINWENVRNKEQGVEIRFRDGLPLDVLQKLLLIKGDLPADNDIITRIWIFTYENKEDIHTYFFTESPNVAYEVSKADFTSKDVEKFISNFGSIFDLYTSSNGDYYLPAKPFHVPVFSFKYTQSTADQLKRSLFVDPGITRNLKERDGSEIYTDAKRGLQISKDQRWFNYSDPVASVDSKNDVSGNLSAGVQFVNQHGGWDGKYAVSRAPQRQTNQSFTFRQYYESYPIINPQADEGYGTIKLHVQKGTVSGYERSMIVPDLKTVKRSDAELPGSDVVEERIKRYAKASSIVSVFPAYQPSMKEDTFMLVPVWAVQLRDGTFDYLN